MDMIMVTVMGMEKPKMYKNFWSMGIITEGQQIMKAMDIYMSMGMLMHLKVTHFRLNTAVARAFTAIQKANTLMVTPTEQHNVRESKSWSMKISHQNLSTLLTTMKSTTAMSHEKQWLT